jgi:hypothetical protein
MVPVCHTGILSSCPFFKNKSQKATFSEKDSRVFTSFRMFDFVNNDISCADCAVELNNLVVISIGFKKGLGNRVWNQNEGTFIYY